MCGHTKRYPYALCTPQPHTTHRAHQGRQVRLLHPPQRPAGPRQLRYVPAILYLCPHLPYTCGHIHAYQLPNQASTIIHRLLRARPPRARPSRPTTASAPATHTQATPPSCNPLADVLQEHKGRAIHIGSISNAVFAGGSASWTGSLGPQGGTLGCENGGGHEVLVVE